MGFLKNQYDDILETIIIPCNDACVDSRPLLGNDVEFIHGFGTSGDEDRGIRTKRYDD